MQQNLASNPEYQRQRRLSLQARGLCVNCGKSKPQPDRCLCKPCRDRKLAQRNPELRRQRAKEDRLRRIAAGMCAQCRNPAIPGKTICEKHKAIKARHNQKAAEASRRRRSQRIEYSKPPSVPPVVILYSGNKPWWMSLDEHYPSHVLERLNAKR